ncbi:MAG: YibE/F family protein [Lachnospiraceae bacterium]
MLKKFLLLIIMWAGVYFVYHNYFLYQSPIAKVKQVETTQTNVVDETSSTQEQYFEQKITARVMNGENKGKEITLKNEYKYSTVDTEKYRKGDDLFLTESLGTITGVKRDKYAALLTVLLLYLLIIIGGKRGILSAVSLAANMLLFMAAIEVHERMGMDLLQLCIILAALYTIFTLLLINGPSRKTAAAICSTFLGAAVTMVIFMLAMQFGEPIDYASLDYIVGNQDLEMIFISSILIAGLGAMMDVGVSMAATIGELIEKDAQISVRQLIKSGREVGYDIMGTMLSVLLFTYLAGLMPMFLIKMKNGVSVITLIKLHIPFEISRFLTGGIGILLSIPISIFCSILFMKVRRKRA